MNRTFSMPPLSKEYICNKMKSIETAVSKLNRLDSSYVAPDLSKEDLFDIFMEARGWLLTQREALDQSESAEDPTHESMEYRNIIQPMRNRIGRST